MKKKFYLLFLLLSFTPYLFAQAQETIDFGPNRSASQNSARIDALLRSLRNNPNGPRIITFSEGVFNFNNPITIRSENVRFKGAPVENNESPITILRNISPDNSSNAFIILGNNSTRVDRVTGAVTLGNTGTNPVGVKDIAFEDLIINNNFRTRAGSSGTIIDNNDSQGTILENVTLKNSDFNGIAARNGNACHGLIVLDSRFENIFNMCIALVNRDSDQYGSELRALRAPFRIENTVFGEGAAVGIEADCGNDFFTDAESLAASATVLEGREINGGGKRHAFPTNLRNSLLRNNTFGRCRRWNIGMVQASNLRVLGNTINGPGAFEPLNGQARPENSNSSNFHFEQFTRGIRIERNVITNNTDQRGPRITSSFISISSNEGRQRLSNNPVIAVIPGIGGIPPRTAPEFNNTFLRGIPGCRVDIRRDPDNLTCRREFHSYGPRNITIRQNSFNTNARVRRILSLRDAINFLVENNNYAGRLPRGERPPGARNGIGNGVLGNDEITTDFINIERGEKGNCNVVINEPQFTEAIIDRIVIEENSSLDNCDNAITINDNVSEKRLTTNDDESLTITVTPNPTTDLITINGGTLTNGFIKVYNLNGSLIKAAPFSTGTQINLSDLNRGIYLVSITSNETNKVIKMVKN